MRRVRPAWRVRAATAFALAAVLVVSGCNGDSGGDVPESTENESVYRHGACWPVYDSGVVAVAMNTAGQVIYISTSEPTTWPEDSTWGRNDRAVNLMDLESQTVRHISHTWEPQFELPAYGTAEPEATTPARGLRLEETLADVALAREGGRFILGVNIDGYRGFGRLYSGEIPADANPTDLSPDEGLSGVPLNDLANLESVRTFRISPDGSKVAAIVGLQGELRVYDLVNQELMVYDQTEGGVQITNELPEPGEERTPAIATLGVINLNWSPDNTHLSLSRAASIGTATLSVFDSATGELTHTATFLNSSAPQVAWAQDGESMFVIHTPRSISGTYLNSELLRLTPDGEELGDAEMLRQSYFTTEPANLESAGTDDLFVFNWEDGLWRLDIPGGDPSSAQFQEVTPDSMTVMYRRPYASADLDKAAFLVQDSGGLHIGVRTALSAESCAAASRTEDDVQ